MDAIGSQILACTSSEARRELLAEFVRKHEKRLLWVIQVRMDRRLKRRIDAADVLQDTFIEAARRLDDYVAKPSLPLFLWFRFLAIQVLHAQYRHHIKAQGRDPDREVPIGSGLDSSWGGGVPVAAPDGTASQIFHRAEKESRLHEALQHLDEVDREVLLLRDFERLTSGETASLLGLTEEAVRQRHVRALRKLKDLLEKSVHDTSRYFVT